MYNKLTFFLINKFKIINFLISVRLNRYLSLCIYRNSAGLVRNFKFKALPVNKHVFNANKFIIIDKLNSYKQIFQHLLTRESNYLSKLDYYNLNEYDTVNQGKSIKTHFFASTKYDLTVSDKKLHLSPDDLPFLDVVDFKKLATNIGVDVSNLTFTRVDLWRNYPIPKGQTKEAYSNFWHMDRFGRNYLRLFCLLSKCSKYNGPFHYLSYEDSLKLSKFCKKLRKQDSDINPSLVINRFIGNYGDALACNTTTIWHKAGNVETQFRDMLAITLFVN